MKTTTKTVNIRRMRERSIKAFFTANGFFSIVVLLGIFILLFVQAWPALKDVPWTDFFRERWDPTSFVRPSYGMLSLIVSTLMVSLGAMVIAVPIGIATAAFLAEVASHKIRETVKPIIEILAGIPSVVIGFLGIVVLGPKLAKLFGIPTGLNAINGSILLAIMSLPTIISISEDAIVSVPQELKNASLALGATRWQTLIHVTIPSALSGIIAAVMLGMGRAIGETMTVLMACGNSLAMPTSYLDAVRTMTATIAIELGEAVQGSTHVSSLYLIAFVLFLMTFAFNMISDRVLRKYQQRPS